MKEIVFLEWRKNMKNRKLFLLIGLLVLLDIIICLVPVSLFPNICKTGEYLSMYMSKFVWCLVYDGLVIFAYIMLQSKLDVIMDLVGSRGIIWNLAKNDFKTRFVGSYLGIFWAFVNPIVTILLYWFVFQFAFKSGDVDGFPFVLWFTAGLVPWFMFSEAVTNGTNSLLEYGYLVKKVVFQVDVLPSVKILSSAFVHVVFMAFTLLIYIVMGYYPSVYTIQLIYYFLCMVVLIMAITYATSAIVLFFRDLGQFINVFMQVFMWMTPIMWQSNIIPKNLLWIFILNPMYYVITGYRDSLLYHISMFQRMGYMAYFWVVVIILFRIGTTIFKRLRPHFADVL